MMRFSDDANFNAGIGIGRPASVRCSWWRSEPGDQHAHGGKVLVLLPSESDTVRPPGAATGPALNAANYT